MCRLVLVPCLLAFTACVVACAGAGGPPAAGGGSGKAVAAAAPQVPGEIDFDGLVLLDDSVKAEAGRTTGAITGTVVNRRGKDLRYVQITFNLYDETGAQVGNAMTNLTGLEAGGRWNFKATTFKQFAKYKVKDVTGR